MCGATLWSLWLARNESVFIRKVWDSKEIFFLIRMRSAFWLRPCDGMESVDEIGWWTEPWEVGVLRTPLHSRLNIHWCPPPEETLKFNVDGSARGKPRPAGCGGAL